jgi:hypothetical protein
MLMWTIVALLTAAYCIVRAILDIRQRQYVWAAVGFILSAAILFMPVQTHAVKVELPLDR